MREIIIISGGGFVCVRWYRGVYRDGVREIIIIRWWCFVCVRWYRGVYRGWSERDYYY